MKSLEPQWRLCFPAAVDFDPKTDNVVVADSQRNRLQVYKKVRDYNDFQANLKQTGARKTSDVPPFLLVAPVAGGKAGSVRNSVSPEGRSPNPAEP